MKYSNREILNSLALSLSILMTAASCATSPIKKPNPKEAFLSHWKETGSKIQVIQVLATQNGMYRGNGIVDGHPIEEFYNPSSGDFSPNAPTHGSVAGTEDKKALYKDLLADLAQELSQSIPANSRIAVLSFPADDHKETHLSSNIALKLEMGLTQAGREVVDREKIDQVLKEHQLQQSQNALFDASTSAQLGKFIGANTVIMGSYHLSMPRKLTITARVLSVETSRVVVIKEKEIPLDGNGSDNRTEIMEMSGSQSL